MRRDPILSQCFLILLLAFALVPLNSCSEEDCALGPPPNEPTPTGWFEQSTPTQETLSLVHAIDANRVVAVGAGGTILRTTDGGATWKLVASGTTEFLRGLTFADAYTGWTAGDNSVILKTTDSGATWTPQPVTVTTNFRDIHFVDANTGWASGGPWGTQTVDAVVLKTVDGGDTRITQLDGFTGNALFFVDADSGCVAQSNGTIYRTTDGGWIAGYEGTILKTLTEGYQ